MNITPSKIGKGNKATRPPKKECEVCMYSGTTEADLKRHSEAKNSTGKFPCIPCEIHFTHLKMFEPF